MDDMTLARFNLFWFLLLFAPMFLMWYAALKTSWVRFISCVALSLLLTYGFSNLAVERKWDLRSEWADTPEELEIAQADGANLVFTMYFVDPAEAVVLTAFWGVVFKWRQNRRKHQAGHA